MRRNSNEFKIYGIDTDNLESSYLLNLNEKYIDFDVTQYNFDYNYTTLLGNNTIEQIESKISLNPEMIDKEFFIKVFTPYYNYSSPIYIFL